jgi:hypothetical protein
MEVIMDQYTGIEMIEELKEIVRDWRAKSERRWAKYSAGEGAYWRETSSAISGCADNLEELISKYDVK